MGVVAVERECVHFLGHHLRVPWLFFIPVVRNARLR